MPQVFSPDILYFLLYLALINALAFALMGLDKYFARAKRRRIPERSLLLTAFLGGAAGALAGMLLFRHKTRHRAFSWGLPLMLAVHGAAAVLIVCQYV